MNANDMDQCLSKVVPLSEATDATGMIAALQLELEQSRRELDRCQTRLAQLDGLFAHVADAIFVVECDGRIIDANPAASELLGYSKQELLTMCPWDFVTNVPREEILATIEKSRNGAPSLVQRACRSKNGEARIVSLRMRRDGYCGRDLIVVTGRDVTTEHQARLDLEKALADRKQSEALIQSEKELTEMIARGDSLEEILNASCRLAEEAFAGSLAIVMLLDPTKKRLRRGAAPSLSEFMTAVDGFEIGPVGTCAAAAFRKEQVITHDIATDPHWAEYRELAARYGLGAGWATPVFSSSRDVLGTFALYWPEARRPTQKHLQIIDQIVRLVAFAIERKQAAEALSAAEKLARGQVNAFTRTLEALAMESETDGLVGHVLRTITDELNAHSASVWRRDEMNGLVNFEVAFEGGDLVTKSDASIVAVKPYMPIHEFWPRHEDFLAGKPSLLEDIRLVPTFPWRDHLLAQGIITVFCVPMLIAGRVEGVTGIRFTHKRTFRSEEVELAKALANQAMLALELTRLSAQSRQAAVMAERNRVARDIHDTLAQGFTGVIMQLEAAKGAVAKGEISEIKKRIAQAAGLARSSLGEARRSVRALRPRSLRDGTLSLALGALLRRMANGIELNAQFQVDGNQGAIPVEWEEGLLRIVQESLTNTIKHAQARNFTATLSVVAQRVELELADDGRGFDPYAENDGFGLVGMKERAEQMGGQFVLYSKPGEGTRIQIVLSMPHPIKPAAEMLST